MATNGQTRSTNRQPRGTPVGGQFAPKSNPESAVQLSDDTAAVAVRTATWAARRYGALWNVDADTVAGETLALFVSSVARAGRPPDAPGAYCSRVARNIAIRQVTRTDRTEVRQALSAYGAECAERSQSYGRNLSGAERDELAERIRLAQPATRRAPPGFHLPAKRVDLETWHGRVNDQDGWDMLPDTSRPSSGDDFAIGSIGDQVERLMAAGGTTEARRLAYSAIAERAGAPLPATGSVTERHATAARKAVSEIGGVIAAIEQWRDGHVVGAVVFAPFGDTVDDQGRDAVATVLASHPNLANELWDGAMSIATIRRRPVLRS